MQRNLSNDVFTYLETEHGGIFKGTVSALAAEHAASEGMSTTRAIAARQGAIKRLVRDRRITDWGTVVRVIPIAPYGE